MGVDGVPSMNTEEDKDNDRKLKEERLIEGMEEQLYKVSSENSSSSRQSPPTEARPSHNQSPVSSTSKSGKRENDDELRQKSPSSASSSSAASIRRRSESLPPPLKKGNSESGTDAPLRKMPFPTFTSQKSEPSSTYSHQLSAIKPDLKDEFSFKTFPISNDNYSISEDIFENGMRKGQPYSSSLENLDPSAKEFLVDAGITLNNMAPPASNSISETNSMLPSATSLPNLARIDHYKPNPQIYGSHVTQPNSIVGGSPETDLINRELVKSDNVLINSQKNSNVEGELSKYLISNEEMKRYEAEYQKASIALKTADSINLQSFSSLINNDDKRLGITKQVPVMNVSEADTESLIIASSNLDTTSINNHKTDKDTNEIHIQSVTIGNGSISNEATPMALVARLDFDSNALNNTTPNNKAFVQNNGENNGFGNHPLQKKSEEAITKASVVPVAQDTPTKTQVNTISTDRNNPSDSIASSPNILSRLSIPSKIAASVNTNIIQDSLANFAGKLEAKRRSLVAATNGNSTLDHTGEESLEFREEHQNYELASKQSRATIMEKKLQLIKEQGIPKKRSLLKPPNSLTTPPTKQVGYSNAHKRFSLTDQMNATVVGTHAIQRLIRTPRQPQHQQTSSSIADSDDSSLEATRFLGEGSECEEKSSGSSSASSDLDSDDPKVTQKMQQVRRLASMDEAFLHNNPISRNNPRPPVGKLEMNKRLPKPPSSSDQPPTHTTENADNLDMVTYVPPLAINQNLGSHATTLLYTGGASNLSSNSNLVVKPIDDTNERASTYIQATNPIANTPENMYPNTSRTMYSNPSPRILPQVPKPSILGYRQPSVPVNMQNGIPPQEANGRVLLKPPTTRNTNFGVSNENVKQQPVQQSTNQYNRTEKETRSHQAQLSSPGYRQSSQRVSMSTLYQQQRDAIQIQAPQPSNLVKPSTTIPNFLTQQDYSDTNNVAARNAGNTTIAPQLNSSHLVGHYRCPPPYPFSPPPPPPPPLKAKVSLENQHTPPRNLKINDGIHKSSDSNCMVEYPKPPTVGNINRFTKVPPPKYRLHQPPSAMKKIGTGIPQQRAPNVMITNTSENGQTNRSSFGGLPSNVTQYNKQPAPQRGLKTTGMYGKSLSAESVLFTERRNSGETEFSDNQHLYPVNTKVHQTKLNHHHTVSNPPKINMQVQSNMNRQRTIAQARTISIRSETPLPSQTERSERPLNKKSNFTHDQQQPRSSSRNGFEDQIKDTNYKDRTKDNGERILQPTFQGGNHQPLTCNDRPSSVSSSSQGGQQRSNQSIIWTAAPSSVASGSQQRRSGGLRIWQNGNNQKTGVISHLPRQPQPKPQPLQHQPQSLPSQPQQMQQQPPRYIQPVSKPIQIARQSSQDNVTRSPSPLVQQRRMQRDDRSVTPTRARTVSGNRHPMAAPNQIGNIVQVNPQVSKINSNQHQNLLRSRMNGIPQPSRNMSNSSPVAKGAANPSMILKSNVGLRGRPSSMHSSPGSSRPSSPHLNSTQQQLGSMQHNDHRRIGLQQNVQQPHQKRRSYQYPPSSSETEVQLAHPNGSTGSLQNLQNNQMEPMSSPTSVQVNRHQSIEHSEQRFKQQNVQPTISVRPSTRSLTAENSIPLPKRNMLQSERNPSRVQRQSLTAQHYMTRNPQQVEQQRAPETPSSSMHTNQPNHTNQAQRLMSNNKNSTIYNVQPRINGARSLPMPGFSSKMPIQKRKQT